MAEVGSSFVAQIVLLALVLLFGRRPTAFRREHRIIQDWARENGMQLLDCEKRQLFRGPFFWTSSENRPVFRITVKDGEGQIIAGWLRLGGWMLGMLSNDVQVLWVQEKPQAFGFPVIFPGDENETR